MGMENLSPGHNIASRSLSLSRHRVDFYLDVNLPLLRLLSYLGKLFCNILFIIPD